MLYEIERSKYERNLNIKEFIGSVPGGVYIPHNFDIVDS